MCKTTAVCHAYFWPVVGIKGGKAGVVYTNKSASCAGRWARRQLTGSRDCGLLEIRVDGVSCGQ